MSKSWTISKLNLKQIKPAYFITGLVFILMLASYITFLFVPVNADNSTVSLWNTITLLPIFAAILIPSNNLRKTINLGAKRSDFLKGSVLTYIILSALTALVIVIFHFAVDQYLKFGVLDMFVAFGFFSHNVIITFIQIFAFLLFFSAFVHTLVMTQDRWYGWLIDLLIIAIISVFTPITILRRALVWFFNLIIFGNTAWQIISCIVLAAIIYYLSKPILNRKKM